MWSGLVTLMYGIQWTLTKCGQVWWLGVWYTVNPNKMWSGLVTLVYGIQWTLTKCGQVWWLWCMVYSEPQQNVVRFGDLGVWYRVNPNKMWPGLLTLVYGIQWPQQNVVRFGDLGVWYTVNPNKMWSGLLTLMYGIQWTPTKCGQVWWPWCML